MDLYWFIVAEDLFHNLTGITHREIDGVIISYFLFGFVTHFHKRWQPSALQVGVEQMHYVGRLRFGAFPSLF